MVGYSNFQRQSVAPLIIIVTAPLVEIAPLIAIKSDLSISNIGACYPFLYLLGRTILD
jgi:hypothetical protein